MMNYRHAPEDTQFSAINIARTQKEIRTLRAREAKANFPKIKDKIIDDIKTWSTTYPSNTCMSYKLPEMSGICQTYELRLEAAEFLAGCGFYATVNDNGLFVSWEKYRGV